MLTRLRDGLSHLRAYKFKHCFSGCINPLWTCKKVAIETKNFFFYTTLIFNIERTNILENFLCQRGNNTTFNTHYLKERNFRGTENFANLAQIGFLSNSQNNIPAKNSISSF